MSVCARVHGWYKIRADRNILPHHRTGCLHLKQRAQAPADDGEFEEDRYSNDMKPKEKLAFRVTRHITHELQRLPAQRDVLFIMSVIRQHQPHTDAGRQLVLVLEKETLKIFLQHSKRQCFVNRAYFEPQIRSQLLLSSFVHYHSLLIEAAYAH